MFVEVALGVIYTNDNSLYLSVSSAIPCYYVMLNVDVVIFN